jgi:TonB family protein
MTRLAITLAIALVILPQAAKCEKAVKGQGPVLVKVLPDYPYAARDQHLEGSGVYRLNIKPDGTVSLVTVLKSTGHILLDQAAIHAFGQWHFRPGALKMLEIPINFTMKGVTY